MRATCVQLAVGGNEYRMYVNRPSTFLTFSASLSSVSAIGKATITPDSAATLQQIAELLSRNTGWKLRIEGHTDDVGHAKDNLVLSRKRAEAVRDWLVAKAKVAAARLETKGLGDTRPVAGNDTDDGRAKNRRVELVKI